MRNELRPDRGAETPTQSAQSALPVLDVPGGTARHQRRPVTRRRIRRLFDLLSRHLSGLLVDDLSGEAVELAHRIAWDARPLPRGRRPGGLFDVWLPGGGVGWQVKTARLNRTATADVRRVLRGRRLLVRPSAAPAMPPLRVEIEHCSISATPEVHAMIRRSRTQDVGRWLMAELRGHFAHWCRMRQVDDARYGLVARDDNLSVRLYAELPITVPLLDADELVWDWADRGLHAIDPLTGDRVLAWYPSGGQVRITLTVDPRQAAYGVLASREQGLA